MKRLTNKQIINMLLPYMESAKKQKVTFQQGIDHPYCRQTVYDENNKVAIFKDWAEYDKNHVVITVFIMLPGKYSSASLSWQIGAKGYGYAKELRGLGNGYYADVDFSGKIIRSECD